MIEPLRLRSEKVGDNRPFPWHMGMIDAATYTTSKNEIEPEVSLNTEIHYVYRDADNYKVHNCCVVKNAITDEQRRIILDSLHEKEYFIPCKVGLNEERFSDYDPEADHIWFEFEFGEDCFHLTSAKPNTGLTIAELTENFAQNKNHWEEYLV